MMMRMLGVCKQLRQGGATMLSRFASSCAGETQMTTLDNGLRIVTLTEPYSSPVASVGLFIDSGSIYEKPEEYGTTLILERLAFKSTQNRTSLQMTREIEGVGGFHTSSASREHMSYIYFGLSCYLPHMLELLVDTVRNPVYKESEVQKLKAEVFGASQNPDLLLVDLLHLAGYRGPLANHIVAPESSVEGLDAITVQQFVVENYTASRMVLVATGVDHEELIRYAKPILSDLPSVSRPEEPPQSLYVGGDWRMEAYSQPTYVALGFEFRGGWLQLKDALTITVMQMLMGGGGSLAVRGLENGKYSQLGLRVVNEYPEIQSLSAFSSIYRNTGFFGIMAAAGPDFVPKIADIAVGELTAVTNPLKIDLTQLKRAKQATKSALLKNLDSRVVAVEYMGKQILTYGERKPLREILDTIEAVTCQDIASVAKKLISSPLTMASYGDVDRLQTYDSVCSKFCPPL
ncbi:Mitochondrial-processing peptidase subunit alpha [Heracleum sosnowskyi]|uniref:Mitochondrial-processing peptidase subunit alpha n=1 Tax=Heracleum sosnowskyi TaxID=360622 RepID=A0AAD8IL33_9APIA|nr:Mitochondrial-processing peptidase subunit alpha [Heracleum sosnowskyi]